MKTKKKTLALLSGSLALLLPLGITGGVLAAKRAFPQALAGEKAQNGRHIVQKEAITDVYVGEVIDLDDYVEVVPGSDDDPSYGGDVGYTFEVYDDSRGSVLERHKSIFLANPSGTKLTAIAPGQASVLVKSHGASLMLNFQVSSSPVILDAQAILKKAKDNYALTWKTSSPKKLYRTADYFYSEITSYGYFFKDKAVYKYFAPSSDSSEIKALAAGSQTTDDFNAKLTNLGELNFRKFRYYSSLEEQGSAFKYAYYAGSIGDAYLQQILNTLQIPFSFEAKTNGGSLVSMTTVGLGLDANYSEVLFYPIASYNGTVYIMDPFSLSRESVDTTFLAPVDAYLKTATLPVAVPEEKATAVASLLQSNISDDEFVANGYNYTLTSSAEILDLNRDPIDALPEGCIQKFVAFKDRVVKVTKRGLWTNDFQNIAQTGKDAETTSGGYADFHDPDNNGNLYSVTYAQKEDGTYALGEYKARNFTSKSSYISVNALSSKLYAYNPQSNWNKGGYLTNTTKTTVNYLEEGQHLYAFGASNDIYLYGFFQGSIAPLISYGTWTNNTGYVAKQALYSAFAQTDVSFDETKVVIDATIPLINNDKQTIGYYHVYGEIGSFGSTTIEGLDAFFDGLENPTSTGTSEAGA